jgi:hypothetical protein
MKYLVIILLFVGCREKQPEPFHAYTFPDSARRIFTTIDTIKESIHHTDSMRTLLDSAMYYYLRESEAPRDSVRYWYLKLCKITKYTPPLKDGTGYLDTRHTSRKRKRHADSLMMIWGGNDGSYSTVADTNYIKTFEGLANTFRGDTAHGGYVSVWDTTTQSWIYMRIDSFINRKQ